MKSITESIWGTKATELRMELLGTYVGKLSRERGIANIGDQRAIFQDGTFFKNFSMALDQGLDKCGLWAKSSLSTVKFKKEFCWKPATLIYLHIVYGTFMLQGQS